ncbi:MAG: Type I Iterative PKS [Bogoriella megaspora]|nr:MAG: Type I Iterative PKS [Bogoriella megaspora]
MNGTSSYSTTPASSASSVSDLATKLSDDVAIIGMACRTAGGNNSPEELWRFIMDKKDGCGENPSWRWEPWKRRDARNAKVIENTISKGYFIEDLENFDAAFFGISPKEAEQMDPHQRLGLEVTWEALENSGIDPKSLSGSDTAVYMGVDSDDYSRLLLEDLPDIEAWMGIGTTAHGIPNRISYHLDLMGPSAAVDAACASSLVAVHSGRQAVVAGESRIAIVGGVNVCLSPALFSMLGTAGALSPEGACLSFDDDAHGYGRGEGAAILILKRLSHAIADGDRVQAIIKGTAIAQDGKTNGIMAPNAKAQELVARKALEVASVDPLTVGFIEAHATSTSLGDPTEISAIAAVYGAGRSLKTPVVVGSIKPNVGHLEAAAGAIGLVKGVMAVNKGLIPPQTRLNKLNTRVDWGKTGLRVVTEPVDWRGGDGPRRAAVCSYGYGGTVSHAIIEQSPIAFPAELEKKTAATLLVISAPQEKRLAIQSAAQAEWISADGKSENLNAIAATLAQRRAHHDFRAAFVVSSHKEAAEAFNNFAKGTVSEHAVQSRIFGSGISTETVWVFSGHGAQWADMGKELLQNPVFRQMIVPLDNIIRQELGYSAIESFKSGTFQDADEIQVLTYLVQIGLSQVLKSKGIQPQAIIGHSVGEIAASVVAGCLKPEEGTIVVTRRARLYAQVKGLGGMVLVNMPFKEVSTELANRSDIVAAIDSSQSSCVVSGAVIPLAKYVKHLEERSVKTFQVKSDIAFHSPMLQELADPLRKSLECVLKPRQPTIRLYSTSQTDSRSRSLRDGNYWINNMVSPVWLTSAASAAIEDGFRIFLEVSSHPIVSHSINETLLEKNIADYATIPTMLRKKPVEKSILQAVAQLHVKGVDVDFAELLGRQWSSEVPGFKWSHKPFWKEVSSGSAGTEKLHDVDAHTLLGQRTVVAGTNMTLFATKLTDSNKPFPLTHQLHGTEIIPAAVYVNTFHHSTAANVISDISLRVPIGMTEDVRNIQVIAEGESIKIASRINSSDDASWVMHSSARCDNEQVLPTPTPFDVDLIQKRIKTKMPANFSKDFLAKVGVAGIGFPWSVIELYGNDTEMLAKVDNDPENELLKWDSQSWAPTFDAASSVGCTLFHKDPKLRIVSQIDKLTLHTKEPAPKIFYLYITEADDPDPQSRSVDVSVIDVHGIVLAKFHSIRFAEVEDVSAVSKNVDSSVHQMAWVPARLVEKPLAPKQAVLLSSDEGLLERYGNEMDQHFSKVLKITNVKELKQPEVLAGLGQKDTIVVYCPGRIHSLEDIASSAQKFIWEVATTVKFLVQKSFQTKLFVITDRVFAAESASALAQGPLYGLSRVIASEHSDIWGGLIDNESHHFPITTIKYVQEQDVVRVMDGVIRVARLRPFSTNQRLPSTSNMTLLPKPEGTYIITGGLGALGLEMCDFLIEKGARRIVIISRRDLPPRRQWGNVSEKLAPLLNRLQAMEKQGASIHLVPLDIGAENAHEQLLISLDELSLPPVLGVIHAGGVLEDSLLVDTTADSFARVLSPKISGAIALHRAFPSASLDFFVLFSSIGQLIGTSGQSSYASGNAFLDTMAAHRRSQGDNAIAFQWTAWRGLGMANKADFLTLELQSRGLTDITRDEAFRAWEYLSRYNVDHAVVARSLAIEEDEPVPFALVEDIISRRPRSRNDAAARNDGGTSKGDSGVRPTKYSELKPWLDLKVRECIAEVLKIADIDEIDSRVALADVGVDSVMTIGLRQKMQQTLKVKVPQTLTWNYPTVSAMVEWFLKQFEEK